MQSSHGSVQPAMVQVTPLQLAVPFAAEQPLPQAPQCESLSMRDVSHPVAAFSSQLPQSSLHVMPQAPASQNGEPLVASQAAVQAPQLAAFVSVLISQPSLASSLQLA